MAQQRELGRWGRSAMALPLVIGLAALALSGCGDETDDATTATTTTAAPAAGGDNDANTGNGSTGMIAELEGRTFISTSVTGHDLVADSVISLTVLEGKISLNAGCNTIGGGIAVDDSGVLAFTGEPFMTMMGCDDDLMAQDTWLNELFTTGVEATLDGANLTLVGGDVTIELAEEADSGLTGTSWTLDGIIENDAVSSLPAGADPATLEIAEDGTASVFAGCNTGGTTVTIGESTLTFDPMRLTNMACEADATTIETAVTTVLDGEVEMELNGKTLTLTKGDKGLMFRAG